MVAAILTSTPLTLVTLSGDVHPTDVSGLFHTAHEVRSRHIVCQAATAAQRNVTASLIDSAISEADRAVLLIAQGIGCATAAWWARLSPRSYVERVAGAVLIAPNTTTARGYEGPSTPLPFPSLVVGASDEAQRLSGEWGSRLLDGPMPGTSTPASNRLRALMLRFTTAIVEKDVRKANRLLGALGDC